MDDFADVMQWHRLWALEHCLAGYDFSDTRALYIVAKPSDQWTYTVPKILQTNEGHVCLQSRYHHSSSFIILIHFTPCLKKLCNFFVRTLSNVHQFW